VPVGSWVVRRLLELDTDVVCRLRDWVSESEVVQADLIGKTNLIRGDVMVGNPARAPERAGA